MKINIEKYLFVFNQKSMLEKENMKLSQERIPE